MSAISTLGLTVATSTKEVRIMPPLYTGAILPVMRHLDHLFASIESLQLLLHIYHLASDFLERHIQLLQDSVAGNNPNQPIPKRAMNAEIVRVSWGQLQ